MLHVCVFLVWVPVCFCFSKDRRWIYSWNYLKKWSGEMRWHRASRIPQLLVHRVFQVKYQTKNRGYPKMDGFIMENTIKIHDLGVPLFLETPMSNQHFTRCFFRCPLLESIIHQMKPETQIQKHMIKFKLVRLFPLNHLGPWDHHCYWIVGFLLNCWSLGKIGEP